MDVQEEMLYARVYCSRQFGIELTIYQLVQKLID